MQTPVIRPFKIFTEGNVRYRIMAQGGLHDIKGNTAPYFALTGSLERAYGGRWGEEMGGKMHDEILRHWPELADLAALHLADSQGVPMHAAENAFYWLAGAAGGWGTEYHGGGGTYGNSPSYCLEAFARHVRVSMDEARAVLEAIEHAADHLGPYSRVWTDEGTKARKAAMAAWCDAQRPRWAREAADCIARHGLQTYS